MSAPITDQKLSNTVICILFFEKVDQTIECIRSFLPSRVPIVVCNNGSSPASRQKLVDFIGQYSHVQLIESVRNRGVSGGRNLIIQSTIAPWLFFVDNDITIQTPYWLPAFHQHLERLPGAEVFIPQLYNVFERTYSPRRTIKISEGQVSFNQRVRGGSLNMFPGGASIVKRTLFNRIGLYDEVIFLNFEDYELCLRAMVSGHPVQAYPIDAITLRHDHRRVSSHPDREYVAIRYDQNRARVSARRLFEKHKLRLEDDAGTWSNIQKQRLLHGRKWWSKETLFMFIPASVKKLWNNR